MCVSGGVCAHSHGCISSRMHAKSNVHTGCYYRQGWGLCLWLNLCTEMYRCFVCIKGDIVCSFVKRYCTFDELQGLESDLCWACSTENHYNSAERFLICYSFSAEYVHPLSPPKKKKTEKKSRRNLGTWLFFKEILKAIGRHKDCLQGAGEVGVTFLQCIVHLPALVQCRFPLEFPGGCWHAGRAATA